MKKYLKNILRHLKSLFEKLKEIIKKDKKKSLIIGIVGILILTVLITMLCVNSQSNREKKLKIGYSLYEKVHKMYFYGEGIDYEQDSKNNYITIEKNEKTSEDKDIVRKYYKIEDYNKSIKNIYSKKKIKDVEEYLHIIKENGSYYIRDIGRGMSGYLKTTLKIKYIGLTKVNFIAESSFCESGYSVSYGQGCSSEEHIYKISKTFSIKKESGKWKVDKYTSIFEFDDSLFK